MFKRFKLNLQFFAGEAGEAAAVEAESATTEGTAEVETEQIDPDAEFERLIKGDYKDVFEKRIQDVLSERLKRFNGLEKQLQSYKEQLKAYNQISAILQERYGEGDLATLTSKLEDDTRYYEDEALAKGLTPEQLRFQKKLERESRAIDEAKRAAFEAERRREEIAGWERQAEEFKKKVPGFDLMKELHDESKGQMLFNALKVGFPLENAYFALHSDEIMQGAMQYTAQTVGKKVVDNIKARGTRPNENGTSSQGAAAVSTEIDWSKKTKQERDEEALRRYGRF